MVGVATWAILAAILIGRQGRAVTTVRNLLGLQNSGATRPSDLARQWVETERALRAPLEDARIDTLRRIALFRTRSSLALAGLTLPLPLFFGRLQESEFVAGSAALITGGIAILAAAIYIERATIGHVTSHDAD